MKLEESFGIVTDNNKQWYKLCSYIAEYIFDIDSGLSSNPIIDDEHIYLSNITSYYKYKYGTNLSGIIPDWIGDFELILDKKIKSSANFNTNATIKDGKLYFTMRLNDYSNKRKDTIIEDLSHEFRHAYTKWIEESKGIKLHDVGDDSIYKASLKGFDSNVDLVSKYDDQDIVINEYVYSNPTLFKNTILRSLYYTSYDEINSFLQEFGAWVQNQINNGNIKIDFNSLVSKKEVAPYNCEYYKIYKSYLEFWNNIDIVEDNVCHDAVNELKTTLQKYLKNNKKSINNKSDYDILIKVSDIQKTICQNVIDKMDNIYIRILNNKNK